MLEERAWSNLLLLTEYSTLGLNCKSVHISYSIFNKKKVITGKFIKHHAHALKLPQALRRRVGEDLDSTPPCFLTAWPVAWPFADYLPQQRSLGATLHIIPPHYLFFSVTLAEWHKRSRLNRGVRGQEEEGKYAGQLGSTVVSRFLRDFTAMKPFEHLTFQLSVKSWPWVLVLFWWLGKLLSWQKWNKLHGWNISRQNY